MRNFIYYLSILLVFILGGCTTMNTKELVEHQLIDRAVIFGNPEITGADLSPDGQYVTFLKEYDGILNIWIKKIDEPFEKAKVLTDTKRPLSDYFWTDDSKYILYFKDNDGDENFNLYMLDPHEVTENKLPKSKNLTPFKDVRVTLFHLSQNNPDYIWIGLNDRDPAWHDLYKLTISSGKLERIYKNTDRITSYEFDWDDNLRILERTDENGNSELFKIDENKKLTKIFETPVSEFVSIGGWTKDNHSPYFITNKGDIDLATLFLFDMNSLKLSKIESDPNNRVDINGVSFNHNTREIIATSYTDDETMYYWKDEVREAQYNYLRKRFPDRRVTFSATDNNYDKFLIVVWGDKYAADTYLFQPNVDSEKDKLIYQYTSRPELKKVEKQLSPMKTIRYRSSDGLEIPGYLTIPVTKKAKNLPLVVLVHGGPKGPRDYWGYDPEVQFLANRGYAVLQPNFRASGGYGKKFLNAGDLQWGRLMQDDITYGVKYLVDKGIVDSKKVVIMGGSYGGYATLAGLAFTPEVYVAGVDIVGPSNLFTLLDSIPAYWEAGRAELYQMTGNPNTEEGKKILKNASPLFSVDKINKPLLIVQGANDPRVKQAESDQIVTALRDKGKKVVYLLAKDEGHGFAKPLNRMAMYAEIEKFLSEVLGGVYQPDMPSDVQKTLDSLRVDVNSFHQ
ncbi:MAG: alpha/beta fold hydrolase [Neisseriaceae bacterium]|nr:MAG: alpha/beta fold hydrolase [Neisseriaceae bacterium]